MNERLQPKASIQLASDTECSADKPPERHLLRIEDQRGESITEATVTVDDGELVDLLTGLADVIEGDREHLHFSQLGGPQLVVRRSAEADSDPLGRQMDWWLGPAVLFGVIFVVIGLVTVLRWAVGLVS
jgi:hypothetical protein